MNITEVRIKLVGSNSERLRAFCSVTLDGEFVIRDLKIIDGVNGPFVAMPSRKLADRCRKCGCKNHLRARFCNECGTRLNDNRAIRDAQGRIKLHADVAHPINPAGRERIQDEIIRAYQEELARSAEPGYRPAAFDEDDDLGPSEYDELIDDLKRSAAVRSHAAAKTESPDVDVEASSRTEPNSAREPSHAGGPSKPLGPGGSFSAGIL
ncbi:MAG: hypothetical protein HBSAPP02_07600 [Phycisphaerae bacterium]|nr:MAG: septation protein SpoVG family protein [Planctomycetia bacterium]GJQ25728.1 MAG: hypothetical protein HBSAPP02_07600 [Phycisphaerae bacterium]